MAERSHISEQKIAALESGQGDFPIGYLFTLASILKFKPQSLLAQCERERRQRMKGIINLLLTCPDETLVKIEEYIRKLAAKQECLRSVSIWGGGGMGYSASIVVTRWTIFSFSVGNFLMVAIKSS